MIKHVLFLLFAGPALMAGNLSGTIDLDTGQPYADASISALDTRYLCIMGGATTDASGNYTIENLPDGTYYLLITGSTAPIRYSGNSDKRDVSTATVVTVSGNTTHDATLQAGGVIEGSIAITDGNTDDAQVFVLDLFSGTPVNVQVNKTGSTYRVTGLETGCYLVGMSYDPDGREQDLPIVYHNGGFSPETATRVNVVAGETTANIDIALNVADLGTYRVTLDAPDLEEPANVTLINAENHVVDADVPHNSPTSIRVPPGTYRVLISYDDTYLDTYRDGTVTIQAGQVANDSFTASRGGSIQGFFSFDPVRQNGQTGEVQAIDINTGTIVESRFFVLSNPTGDQSYILDGMPDGDFAVRVNPSLAVTFNPLFQDTFTRQYHPAKNTLADAEPVTIEGGSNRTGINFPMNTGVGFTIGLTENGGEPANLPAVVVAEAIEVNTGEVYTGGFIPGLGGGFFGIPAGTYKVGVGTGFTDGNTLTSTLLSLGTVFCPNLGPAFHENAETLDTADSFDVVAIDVLNPKNIEMRTGGIITGSLAAGNCNYPVLNAWVGAFQDGRLVRLALPFGKDFELAGLGPGSYTLRAVLPTARGQELPDINTFNNGNIKPEDLFDFFRNFTYSTTVTVARGQVTSVGNWCLGIDALGDGDGGGGNGGGNDETHLLYPWVSNRAEQFESILVANNTGTEAMDVSLTATRNGGESETVNRTIPAGGFLQEQASSLFPTLGDGPGYSVLLTAPNDSIRGRWVTNNLTSATGRSPSQGVAVRVPASGETERVGENLLFNYLPTTNNFISAPVVVNVGDVPTDVTLTYYTHSGSLVSTATLEDLAPNQPFAQVVQTANNVYMTATSSGEPITGVSFVFNDVGETAIGNASTINPNGADGGSKRLLYPWVSNREGQFESIVIANNYSDSPVTMTLTARRADGTEETVNREIGASGFLEEQASTLFPTLGSGGGYAVELTAPTSKFSGAWVTNNLTAASMASPSQGIAVDIDKTSGQRVGNKVLFGFLPLTNDFISAPVVVNASDSAADITLTFYDSDGNQVGRDTMTLAGSAPLRPFATVAANLVNTSGDVYMVAESTAPITGVVFVFNSAGETAIGNVTSIP